MCSFGLCPVLVCIFSLVLVCLFSPVLVCLFSPVLVCSFSLVLVCLFSPVLVCLLPGVSAPHVDFWLLTFGAVDWYVRSSEELASNFAKHGIIFDGKHVKRVQEGCLGLAKYSMRMLLQGHARVSRTDIREGLNRH